jgi:hypothetical protein
LLLVGESKELSPELIEGLPVIDLFSPTGLQAHYADVNYSRPKDRDFYEHSSLVAEKFRSLLENIKKANAAAARAFAYVKAELAKKGVDIKFENDLFYFNEDETMPSPAYFVLHHGDSYKITAETSSIIDKYEAWVLNDTMPRDRPPMFPWIYRSKPAL